ncbi:MAG: YidC/Oxa1 family membrane protein insertase [Oscillospiraceae bacterium]|jgi:YidC/Oxa1 family membrane protein insertase|nr:YidC/Oxa1 family membrane protein insertase [Oscillospiraceae bacterium]
MSLTEIVTAPFSWLLTTLYSLTFNYGLAVILFALVIKIILLPFQMKSKRSMMRTARLTPLLKELEKKHEGNKQKYQEEVAKLYREEKVSPMSGCLWTLIPFPILLALYSVIRQPLTKMMGLAAEQITEITDKLVNLGLYTLPEKASAYSEIGLADLIHRHFADFQGISNKLIDLDYSFLRMNLGQTPQWNFFMKADWGQVSSWLPALGLFLIPVVSGLLSFLSAKVSNASNPAAAQQQQQMKGMTYMMPLVSVYIGFVMPAALGIYWIAQSAFTIVQDAVLNRHYNRLLDIEDAERRERLHAREAELEKKRLETERLREQGATERNKSTSKKKIQATQKAQNDERLAAERARERAKRRAALGLTDEIPAAQVGNRRFARGRAYVPDRFTDPENAGAATEAAAALSELDEAAGADLAEQTDAANTPAAAEEAGTEENS